MSGTYCAEHPKGRSGKRFLTPFSALPVLAALGLACSCGCIRRTLEVTSEPPGAQLIVNGHPAGVTPLKLRFRFHGVYRLELRRAGCQPVTAAAAVPARFYEFAGPDFVAEVLWPGEILDARHVHYKLEPERPPDKDKLLSDSRRAAAEAERLMPVLQSAPAPNPKAKDRAFQPGRKAKPPKPEAQPAPEAEKPPVVSPPPEAAPEPAPVGPEKAPPKTRKIPEPTDVPEIEKGR